MTDAEKMLLADAIEESFKANAMVNQLRKTVIILATSNIAFIVIAYIAAIVGG